MEALELAQGKCPEVPFLFVSGISGEDAAIEALKHGASDYVRKHRLMCLVPVVDRALREAWERAECQRVEDAMRQLEHKYRELFERLGDAAFLAVEHNGKIIDTNRRAATVLGCTRADILGCKETRFLALDETRPRTAAAGMDWQTNTAEGRLICRDGRMIPVEVRSTRLSLYDRPLVLRLAHDLSDDFGRSLVEDQLKASFKEISDLKAALDEHAMVAVTDPQGRITNVNDKFCAISKYSRAESLGQDHRIINSGFHPKEFIQDLWTTIAHGKVWKGEIKNQAKDGSFYWVDTTIVPFFNREGKPCQYVAIRADITDRKLAEEKIRQFNAGLEQRILERTAQLQAANLELEAFSYSVSHDLRAPLRHIAGFVELLGKDAASSLSEKGRRYLETISKSANRMGGLIDDLLAFSRVGRTALQKMDVNLDELVRETLGEFETETTARHIAWEIHPLPAVRADPALLRWVLTNLLSNAVKFTSGCAAARIEIGLATNDQNETVIFVRDNGAGFDPRYAAKLFGVFQRLHSAKEFEGTGIGLVQNFLDPGAAIGLATVLMDLDDLLGHPLPHP